ncbi:MAG: HdeD family acid-resistance protein [Chthoniobacterales bacterium]|nr:HdeD family acid-resistance protein [Chthoniobacterales bacterium]
MTTENTLPSSAHALSKSRGWLIIGGLLSIFVGFSAIGSPLLFSLVITQFLGLFALISGIISLGLAIFGKHTGHRIFEALSGILRIVAGAVLLNCLATSVAVITLIFAIFLVIEGISVTVTAFLMRATPGWVWMLISGVASVVLGVMVFNRWPSDSTWVLGLLFGINLIFSGTSLLALGLAARKPDAA